MNDPELNSNRAALRIPDSLQREHRQLHEDLTRALHAGGETGVAARTVADVLHPHFVEEERIALPPLGLLIALAHDQPVEQSSEVVAMTELLSTRLGRMLSEHEAIGQALDHLAAVARQEGKPEYATLAETIRLHALTEEEVLYPAAIVVGKLLKLKQR